MAEAEPPAVSAASRAPIVNINIGVLGHVDSGKTSLARALSQRLSTASMDKTPEEKRRGITLDLGFSSFDYDVDGQRAQFTLVDCPGHASLIRTIIGGAQIIDMMVLVVDANKGIQTQTAECIVIGELLADSFVIVLNKVDLLPPEKRAAKLEKLEKRLRKALAGTKMASAPMVATAACPGGAESIGSGAATADALGVDELLATIAGAVQLPVRSDDGPFLFAVDHCFPIRGQGTVMTGTVLSGSVTVGDTVELPSHKMEKKVKSMQMFHESVERAGQGDRVGMCVTQLDAKLMERGLLAGPGTVPTFRAALVCLERVPFFKGECKSKGKFHITMGHATVMGALELFSPADGESVPPGLRVDVEREYLHMESLEAEASTKDAPRRVYALLELETAVTSPLNSTLIGSRLDFDVDTKQCRIAFHARLLQIIAHREVDPKPVQALKVYKTRQRFGTVDRVMDADVVIGRNLFKKETNISQFLGLNVTLGQAIGVIEGNFGKTGKFKVRFREGHGLAVSKKGDAPVEGEERQLMLQLRKWVFLPSVAGFEQ